MADIQQIRTPDLSGLKLSPDATFGKAVGSSGQLATADALSPETTIQVTDFLKNYAGAFEVASKIGDAKALAPFDQRIEQDLDRTKRLGTALADLKDLSVDITPTAITRNPTTPDRLSVQAIRTDEFVGPDGRTQTKTFELKLDLGITAEGMKVVAK